MKALKSAVVFGLVFLAAGAAFAADEPMTAEEKAQMGKMKALMAPAAAHKALEAFVGKWNYASEFWQSPDGKPEETAGTAEHTMIYGGRFLKQEVRGTWMGEPFEGMGITGFDNIRGQYQTIWIDSMATGMMSMSGQYDLATQTLSQSGTNSCPLTGEKDRRGRSEWKVTDADHNTYVAYLAGPDGKQFKAMEIRYERTAG